MSDSIPQKEAISKLLQYYNDPNLLTDHSLPTIDKIWNYIFVNIPLSSSKEIRIQQSLNFLQIELKAHDLNKSVIKHSFRQIATFFKIPKSTLYDRNKSNRNDIIKPDPNQQLQSIKQQDQPQTNDIIDDPSVSDKRYKRYEIQMKLSVNKEFQLLNDIRTLSHAYGDIPSNIQLDRFIRNHIDSNVELGSTWLRGFLNRHKDETIFGPNNGDYSIPVELMKVARGHHDCLKLCIIEMLHNKLTTISKEYDEFYSICHIPINNNMKRNSLVMILKFDLNNKSVNFFRSPTLIISNKPLVVTSEEINNNNNKDLDDKESTNILPDRLTLLLNSTIRACVNECVAHDKSVKPLIYFEGFTESFHWNIPFCEDVLKISDFLTMTWNENIFHDILFHYLNEKVFKIIQNIDTDNNNNNNDNVDILNDITTHEFNIGVDESIPSLSNDLYNRFQKVIIERNDQFDGQHMGVDMINGSEDEDNDDNSERANSLMPWSQQDNKKDLTKNMMELNNITQKQTTLNTNTNTNFDSTLFQVPGDQALNSALDTSPDTDISLPLITNDKNNHPDTSPLQQEQDPKQHILAQTFPDELTHLTRLIDQNETHLYDQIPNVDDKELLKNIFNRVKMLKDLFD